MTKQDFELIKIAVAKYIDAKESTLRSYCLGEEKSYRFKQELEEQLEDLYTLQEKLM